MKGHIRKRGNSWCIKYDIGRDPKTGARKTKWETFRTRKEAEAARAKRITAINEDAYVEPTKTTLAEYAETWLALAVHRLAGKTFERYKDIVDGHIIPYIGQYRLSQISPTIIEGFYADLLTEGRRVTKHHKLRAEGERGLSKQTVLHIHRLLNQILKSARKKRLILTNPCEDIDRPPRPESKEMTVLSVEEMVRVIDAARNSVLFMPVLLAATTGMRRGEALAVRWRDIDLDRGTLQVVRSLEQTKEGGLHFKAPKTKRSRRVIFLAPTTIPTIREFKAAQARERLKQGKAYEDNDLVCCHADGTPLIPNIVSNLFGRLVAKLGLDVRFHDLRHSHITQFLRKNIHPKIVSERAGHSNVSTTLDLYSHVVEGLQEEAAKAVDEDLRTFFER